MDKTLLNGAKFAFALGGIALIPNVIYDVDAGKRAVMFNRFGGVSDQVYAEGSHFYVPWFQSPVIYDVTTRALEVTGSTGTRDLQLVRTTLRILFRPKVDALPIIHKQFGPDYENVLNSIANEILKSVIAQFDAESLITRRPEVGKAVIALLRARAAAFNIEIDDVSLKELAYGRDFTNAIEQKKVAEQEAERSKHNVERIAQEQKAALIMSEGEAEAAKIIADALAKSGNGMLAVRRLEAAKEIALTLAGSPNVNYLPSGEGAQMIFQLPK